MHPAVREFLADVQSDVANFNVRHFVTSCCERTLSHHRRTPDVQQSTQRDINILWNFVYSKQMCPSFARKYCCSLYHCHNIEQQNV
jgi:hypothetical protein